MNAQMAYLLGMILGNGEVQQNHDSTTVTLDIPHKNLLDDEGRDVTVYVKASLTDIRDVIEPLLGHALSITQTPHSTKLSFRKNNQDYAIREILRFISNGVHHSTMKMNNDLFLISTDEKKELLRGIADVTGYIRKSNIAFGQTGQHRVYIEIPRNWEMVIDIANILKEVGVPIQTIDFGHPNFRDSNIEKYNSGKPFYWKKEHQIKIWANEFLPIGFKITHKQKALEKYSKELLSRLTPEQTHKFYWEKPIRRREKPLHPCENDISLPAIIRGEHFESWTDLAKKLGYHD
ncbi:putative uncharacterized protein [Acetobacter sp. CAG:977]|mgnify:CR=1 FL=1|nr:putative uncharacterized protein [Acetobacter sp. CAG:977]